MRGVASAIRQFTKEMWKRGGIQMVILTRFKDEKGEVFSNWYVYTLHSKPAML